jgi:transposase InsO family protein
MNEDNSEHITIPEATLDEIEARILSDEATWKDCCRDLRVLFNGEWQLRTITTKTLRNCFVRSNRTPPKRPRGPRKPANEQDVLRVILLLRDQMIVGIDKMYQKLNQFYTRKFYLQNQHTSRRLVEQIYLSQGWTEHKIKQTPRYRCRVTARRPNCLWRSDLHDCHNFPFKLMIILDDCSRKVLGWKLLADKESATTAEVLIKTISNYGPVAAFLTDNGGEFSGNLLNELVRGLDH